jgi:hypothetical protein
MPTTRAPQSTDESPAIHVVAGRRLAIVDRPIAGRLVPWARVVGAARVGTVVSCLEPQEELELGIADEGQAVRAVGMRFVSIPIEDCGTPDIHAVLGRLLELLGDLAAGESIAIHCAYGIGRSPMVAATLLALDGQQPADAWLAVGQAVGRPVPDNERQYGWVSRACLAIRPLHPGTGIAMMRDG